MLLSCLHERMCVCILSSLPEIIVSRLTANSIQLLTNLFLGVLLKFFAPLFRLLLFCWGFLFACIALLGVRVGYLSQWDGRYNGRLVDFLESNQLNDRDGGVVGVRSEVSVSRSGYSEPWDSVLIW